MSWKDDKDLGSWNFTEQGNKFGYLNNKRWSSQQDAQEFCEDMGISLDPTHTHRPCGHWHKGSVSVPITVNIGSHFWNQGSIDLSVGDQSDDGSDGIEYAIVFMYVENFDIRDGIVGMAYINGEWIALGLVRGISIAYAVPNTARTTDDYTAYFCSCYDTNIDPGLSKIYFDIFIFRLGEDPIKTIVWESDASDGDPYYAKSNVYYGVMDCYGNRIACVAYLYKEGGGVLNKCQIKISNDAGVSFPVTWTFPDAVSSIGAEDEPDDIKVKISKDGIVWVGYLRSSLITATKVELWKSNAGATSWNKIWEKDYYSDLNDLRATGWNFNVDYEDGKYIAIFLNGGYKTPDFHHVIYESRDCGVTFNTHQQWLYDYVLWDQLTTNKQYMTVLASRRSDGKEVFLRSIDYGVNFSEVDPDPIPLTGTYLDQQQEGDTILYIECGESFYPAASRNDTNNMIISYDNGATWSVLETEVQNTSVGAETKLPSGAITTANEPQVWPMD